MFLSLCLCFMNPVMILIVGVGDDLCLEWDYVGCQDVVEEDKGASALGWECLYFCCTEHQSRM